MESGWKTAEWSRHPRDTRMSPKIRELVDVGSVGAVVSHYGPPSGTSAQKCARCGEYIIGPLSYVYGDERYCPTCWARTAEEMAVKGVKVESNRTE